MASPVSLESEVGASSALIHSTNTDATYKVTAKFIGPYFDGYWVKVLFEGNRDLSGLKEAAKGAFGLSGLEKVAICGAKQAVLAEEVKQIAAFLATITTNHYNLDGRLQAPQPKYYTDENGKPSAFFTAHFANLTFADLDERAGTGETADALKRHVFESLNSIHQVSAGFYCISVTVPQFK